MTNREAFKKALPQYMDKANMNQRELAKAVGMSESIVHCWITGKAFPRIDVIQKIADVLGCATDDLLATHTMSFVNISHTQPIDIGFLEDTIKTVETQRQIREREYQKELEIIKIFRSLTPQGHDFMLEQAKIAKKMFSER